jgi:hypothetical protein
MLTYAYVCWGTSKVVGTHVAGDMVEAVGSVFEGAAWIRSDGDGGWMQVADGNRRLLRAMDPQYRVLSGAERYVVARHAMLTYAHVCSRMLTYADVR